MRIFLFSVLCTVLVTVPNLFTPASAQEAFKIVEAREFAGEWKGWGRYSEPSPHGLGNLPIKEQLRVVPTATGQARRFSGKVTGLTSYQGALVGLVSIVDVWWTNRDCYEWAPVQPDGSFSIEAKAFPKALKALCVIAPGQPYSFLRYNFQANESGQDIVLRAKVGKLVRFSVETPDVPAASWFFLEPFEAYRSFDDVGQPLAKQEYGKYTAERGEISLYLPEDEPVAFYIRGRGAAQHYTIVETGEADHFHFKLLPEAKLTGRLMRGDESVPNTSLRISCDAVPLSVTFATTDKDGKFERDGLAPGKYNVEVGSRNFTAVLKSGQTTETTFSFPPLAADETIKEIPATNYFLVSKLVTQNQIQSFADEAIDGLEKALKESGMEPSGPIEFHYLDSDPTMTKPFTLEIAFPVKAVMPYKGPYTLRSAPAMRCVSTSYRGAMAGMPEAWKKLTKDVKAAGYRSSNEGREVYWTFTQPEATDNVTEILMGIEK